MRPSVWLTLDPSVCPALPAGEQAPLQLVRVEECDQPGMVILFGWRYNDVDPGPTWARLPAVRTVLPDGHEHR